MYYREFKTINELQNYINSIWIYKSTEDKTKNQKTFADGSTEIVFKFLSSNNIINPDLLEQKYIIGEKTKYKEFQVKFNETFIGIKLKPGFLYPLITLPMNEITDKSYISTFINQNLFSNLEKFNNISDFLKTIQKKLFIHFNKEKELNNSIKNAVNIIISKKGIVDIKKLSTDVCMSIRNLQRKFIHYIGITPKKLCCLVRYKNAINYLINYYSNNNKINLTEIAILYEYFDQSHFNHDFKQYTGMNPTSFLNYIFPE